MNDYSIEAMREIMIRNDFYLPQKKCAWMTKKLMTAILLGTKYCPKYEDLKLRPCPVPPPKALIIKEVCKEIADKINPRMVWSIDVRYGPDVEWLMIVLSTLNPEHEFFSKSYYPTRQINIPADKIKQMREDSEMDVDIFHDLPDEVFIKRKKWDAISNVKKHVSILADEIDTH